MPSPLLIRADASTEIGTGHVMRCLALAQAWMRTGGRVVFAQLDTTPSLERRLRAEGVEPVRHTAVRGSAADAAWTIGLARSWGATWVVADGYAFDASWQRQLRAAGQRLLVIDDYGQAEHYAADLVLNQNAGADARWYAQREAATRVLLGSRFALLRQEFLQARVERPAPSAPATQVLITLGGGDPDNVTGWVLDALAGLPGFEFTVVVGGSNPHRAAIEAMARGLRSPARVIADATNMPDLMMAADLVISAAGSTTWELAYLGKPAVLLVVADNQRGIAAALANGGVAVNLGEVRALVPEQLAATVVQLRDDAARRAEMARRGRALIDGHGARRVVAALGAPLRLTFVSDAASWLNAFLPELKAEFERAGHAVAWIHDPALLSEGDAALFLSLSRIVPTEALGRHAHNLVVHESAVPAGRGWSPLTWQVLEGKHEIPVTLLEAAAGVDSGDVLAQTVIRLRGDELVDELRTAQAAATAVLCREFIARYPFNLANARPQAGEPSHYPRRRPADSRLDPDRSLREQFNLLRVADPVRYPAYFEMAGRRYEVRITATEGVGA